MTKTGKINGIIGTLSEDAKRKIGEADGTRQGSMVWLSGVESPGGVSQELRLAGLIGPRGGLTMLGSIVAEKLRDDLIEEMFA